MESVVDRETMQQVMNNPALISNMMAQPTVKSEKSYQTVQHGKSRRASNINKGGTTRAQVAYVNNGVSIFKGQRRSNPTGPARSRAGLAQT